MTEALRKLFTTVHDVYPNAPIETLTQVNRALFVAMPDRIDLSIGCVLTGYSFGVSDETDIELLRSACTISISDVMVAETDGEKWRRLPKEVTCAYGLSIGCHTLPSFLDSFLWGSFDESHIIIRAVQFTQSTEGNIAASILAERPSSTNGSREALRVEFGPWSRVSKHEDRTARRMIIGETLYRARENLKHSLAKVAPNSPTGSCDA